MDNLSLELDRFRGLTMVQNMYPSDALEQIRPDYRMAVEEYFDQDGVINSFIPHYSAHMKFFERALETHAEVERVLAGLTSDEVQQYKDICRSVRFPWREMEVLTKHGGESVNGFTFVFPAIFSTFQQHVELLAHSGVSIDISRLAGLRHSLRFGTSNGQEIVQEPPVPRVIALSSNTHTTGNMAREGYVSLQDAEKEVGRDGGLSFANVEEVVRYLLVKFLSHYLGDRESFAYISGGSRADVISAVSKEFQREKREGLFNPSDTHRTQFPQHSLDSNGSILVLENPHSSYGNTMGDLLSFVPMNPAEDPRLCYNHVAKPLVRGFVENAP